MKPAPEKISRETVRADFNDPTTVIHYARAADSLGLWASERILIRQFFPSTSLHLLEAGCGAGRVALALWQLGYRHLTAFDFAEELLDQARSLAAARGAGAIRFLHADATDLDAGSERPDPPPGGFDGALFLFNGLMQIPGREQRRTALRQLHRCCRAEAPLLFTTHDRTVSALERRLWILEARRWANGTQDPRLLEFGDRYFSDETGNTFMHLPVRSEILADLAATGWRYAFDAMRREIAAESAAVRDFSDENRFWVARRAG